MARFEIPPIYPGGGPLYWMNEQSGVLPTAIWTYISDKMYKTNQTTPEQIEIIVEYLHHWIYAPAWMQHFTDYGMDESHALVVKFKAFQECTAKLSSVEEIAEWLIEALKEFGIDPL